MQPHPSRSSASGEEGRCWASPAQPLPFCPLPRILPADRREGGKNCLRCPVRAAAPGSWAGLCPALPTRCLPQPPALSVGHPAQAGTTCPAMALPSPDLGQVWAEVEQGGWEVGRGSCSFDAQPCGQGAWAHILIPPLLPSLSRCYLYLGLFLTFPTGSSMGERRYPLILPPTNKHSHLRPCKQCRLVSWSPLSCPLGRQGGLMGSQCCPTAQDLGKQSRCMAPGGVG